ncbi:hypothetical protein N5D41_11550 [Pseudomonas toyotomiensis]|uniref:Uncharacterized protein n=1 Tax=Ectopseudomonas toyotomiensis TaxID=554344 RepID=A0AA42LE38_9GAMM|nr:hypothetical protein [Pseudomonas toyotomiensis]MDH0702121.1 hypothetical protein [Pseudomonas toyotomiensis]
MWLDSLTPEGELSTQRQRLQTTSEVPEPGFWQGAGDAIGPGLLRGGLEAGAAVESGFSSLWQGGLDLAASVLLPEPRFGGEVDVTSAERGQQQDLGQGVAEVVKDLRPDARTTGLAGQLLGEAAAILPRTVVGAVAAGPVGAAAAAGGPAGYSVKQVAMSEGIDEDTATIQGAIEGVTIGIGAALPAARFVKPLAGDLAIAVGANVGLGVASRGATSELLDSRGYTEQAAQYRAFDGTAMTIDAVLGAAFFGIGRGLGRAPTDSQVSAALAENNSQHAALGTAPGIPVDAVAANTHVRALDIAMEQLARGEPVRLPADLPEAAFLRVVDESPVIAPARAEIQAQAMEVELPVIRAELEQQAAQAVPNVRDLRTETTTLQRTLAGLDDTFRDRAKTFQGEGLSRKQAEGQARQAIQQERGEIEQRLEQISQQIETNRQAEVARGDLAAIDRGEVPARLQDRVSARAAEIDRGFQRRPLADQVQQGNQQLSIRQMATQEMARLIDEADRLDPRPDPVDIPAPRRPAAGEQALQQDAQQAQQNAPEAQQMGQEVQQPGAGAADPEVQVAQLVLDEIGDIQVPTGAIDADGKPVTVSARELLAQADNEIQRAQIEARGIEAAAACSLQRGE